jgi:hypothetical protein
LIGIGLMRADDICSEQREIWHRRDRLDGGMRAFNASASHCVQGAAMSTASAALAR